MLSRRTVLSSSFDVDDNKYDKKVLDADTAKLLSQLEFEQYFDLLKQFLIDNEVRYVSI